MQIPASTALCFENDQYHLILNLGMQVQHVSKGLLESIHLQFANELIKLHWSANKKMYFLIVDLSVLVIELEWAIAEDV